MANKKFVMKNYNGVSWDELYPKTQGDNVVMTNYAKPAETSAILAADSLNAAIGKVEKALDGKQNTLSYTAENTANKGVANGYAGLGSDGKVPTTQLPDSVVGGMEYKGAWDASSEVYPSNPETGFYYIISVQGTISTTLYHVGDWIVYNGTSWDKIDNTDSVTSVNTKIGAVVLNGADVVATGYVKPGSASAVTDTDTLNAAIGKLEKGLDGKQASGSYVTSNDAISAGTNQTKISYDAKGLVTAGGLAVASDFKMTGYTKAGTVADVSAVDDISAAIGKVEKKAESKLSPNVPITGATKTKVTYDANGLVTAGADAVASDFVMTGYSKASSIADVAGTDTISAAVGKVEKKVDSRPMVFVQDTQPTASENDFWFQVI
jgi:hypothetical protein